MFFKKTFFSRTIFKTLFRSFFLRVDFFWFVVFATLCTTVLTIYTTNTFLLKLNFVKALVFYFEYDLPLTGLPLIG